MIEESNLELKRPLKMNYIFSIGVAWKKVGDENAIKPCRAHDTDAGYDLYADKDYEINPSETILVHTGYAVQQTPPEGWNSFGKIEDTSGNALKVKIKTAGGVIDKGYQGEIGVVVRNNSNEKVVIKAGKKIAQIVFHLLPLVKEIEWKEKETDRGSNGFGSTGVANA